MTTVTPTNLTAAADFASWTTNYSATTDPIRRTARVMAAMTAVQAQVLQTQTLGVTQITDRMARINEVMKKVNEALDKLKSRPDTETTQLFVGTQAEAQAMVDVLKGEGISSTLYSMTLSNAATATWQIVASKQNLTTINSNLQLAVDSLSSITQQAQLGLQTMLGRYNGTFEVVTSAIKKHETQAEALNANIKR